MRVEPTDIAKLKTAEGTVVEGTSEEAKHPPKRVPRATVYVIPAAEDRQAGVVADRTLRKTLEQGKERAIEIRIRAASLAAVRGSGNDPAISPSGTPHQETTADVAGWHLCRR